MGLPKLMVRAAADFEPHEPEEWLPGKIIDIEETPDDRGFGAGLKYILILDDDELREDGSERETWAFSSQIVSRKSKLGKWGLAILGDAMPPEGEPFDLNLLLQVPVEVFFEQFEGENDEGKKVTKEKVLKIRARKRGKAARPKVRTVVENDEPNDDEPYSDEPEFTALQLKQQRAKAARKAKADDDVEPF